MRRLTMLPVLDRSGVRLMANELRDMLDLGGAISIDAGKVERIGLAGIQLLLSALRTGAEGATEIRLIAASRAVEEAARVCGVPDRLLGELIAGAEVAA